MILTSPAFKDKEFIPYKFTCEGGNINPELHIQYVPDKTQSLALLAEDTSSPHPNFLHWLVWDINPDLEIIKEDSKPPFSFESENDFGGLGYGGPCPRSGGEHVYVFHLFALNIKLGAQQDFNRKKFLSAISGHILADCRLEGKYKMQMN